MCRSPFVKDGTGYGCGQCLPCLINRRRDWATRMMLEASLHRSNSFVTLTYSDEHVPYDLDPRVVQLWLKRLRDKVAPSKFRFYGVGEYSSSRNREWNPHYHFALFGYPPCVFGKSRFPRSGGGGCCPFCNLVRDSWGKGFVEVGTLTFQSANYIAQYVTKKLTRSDDDRLEGRRPEFARMSMRPGIAAGYAPEVARSLLQKNALSGAVDVPSQMQLGERVVPIPRFLRLKLRSEVGRSEKTPASVLEELEKKLLPLRARAERLAASPLNGYSPSKALVRSIFQRLLSEEHQGAAGSKVARFKIFQSKRGSL